MQFAMLAEVGQPLLGAACKCRHYTLVGSAHSLEGFTFLLASWLPVPVIAVAVISKVGAGAATTETAKAAQWRQSWPFSASSLAASLALR
jgi:hypothetical protein